MSMPFKNLGIQLSEMMTAWRPESNGRIQDAEAGRSPNTDLHRWGDD
jgi:hypothetical protein